MVQLHSFEENEMRTHRGGDESFQLKESVGRPSPPPSHFGAGDNIRSGGGDGSVMVLVFWESHHHSTSRQRDVRLRVRPGPFGEIF